MSSRAPRQVALVGERADFAAQPFEADWGRVRIADQASAETDSADITVILDPALAATQSAAPTRVVWSPEAHAQAAPTLITRPWPVADDLFELPPSSDSSKCLLLVPDGLDSGEVVERLTETGLTVTAGPGATRRLLAEARVVVCLSAELPAETFGILAAGRLLVAPATERTFGLQPWIDHLPFSSEEELVSVAGALAAYPKAWAPIRAFARQTAEPHRARRAIGRVVRRMQASA
jgi:hypothetical protein